MKLKKIITALLVFTVLCAVLISCGSKSGEALGFNEREIKNIVVDAIKEDLDSSYAVVTSMNYTIQDNVLIVRAKVLMPKYCFYELQLERQDSTWVVIRCGQDI